MTSQRSELDYKTWFSRKKKVKAEMDGNYTSLPSPTVFLRYQYRQLLLEFDCWPLLFDCWLLLFGCWLLLFDCWPLLFDCCPLFCCPLLFWLLLLLLLPPPLYKLTTGKLVSSCPFRLVPYSADFSTRLWAVWVIVARSSGDVGAEVGITWCLC